LRRAATPEAVTVSQLGHYPMLEKPAELNRALERCLGAMRAP